MKKIFYLGIVLLVLSGCNQAPPETLNKSNEENTVIQYEEEYKINAPLSESPIRGITLSTDAFIDYDLMETELLEITKEFLNPKDYFYKPGQVLSSEDANELLQRESEDYPNGLNPSGEDSPIYVNTIVEQDFYTIKDNGDENLKTIAFGFGIDTVYETENKDINISNDEIENFITQYVSDKMVNYIRNIKDLKDVNVICAFFKESNQSSVPGVYYTYGETKSDETRLSKVLTKDLEYKKYPNYSSNEALNLDIIDLTNEIDQYFSTFSGVSGLGKFENGNIQDLELNIIVTLYSKVELEALEDYIKDNISGALLEVPNVVISIELPNGDLIGLLEYENGKLVTEYLK